MAARTLTSPGHAGKTYELNGPEALTYREVAEKITQASGLRVQYVDIPVAQQKQAMLDQRLPEWLATTLLDLQAYYTSGKGGEVDDVVSTIGIARGIPSPFRPRLVGLESRTAPAWRPPPGWCL